MQRSIALKSPSENIAIVYQITKPFIMTNMSPDKVKILPNEATREKVVLGYKDVRAKYIDFVKKYNASKTAGTITLNSNELEALKGLIFFFDMEEHNDKLNVKFPDGHKTLLVLHGRITPKFIRIG